MTTPHLSKALSTFAAELKIGDIPEEVIARTEDLLVDWFGSAIAGKGSRPVETITQFAQNMGGFNNANPGPSEILIHRTNSSPFLATLANAAASHVAEQDDVHNGSVFHPATVVFPAALATAQTIGTSGEDLLVAAVAGYEVGIRVGEFLGRSHYKVFHTTGTAGTIAAVGQPVDPSGEWPLHPDHGEPAVAPVDGPGHCSSGRCHADGTMERGSAGLSRLPSPGLRLRSEEDSGVDRHICGLPGRGGSAPTGRGADTLSVCGTSGQTDDRRTVCRCSVAIDWNGPSEF